MVTTVYDWILVSVYDQFDSKDQHTFVGKVIFGYVLDDQTCRFYDNDYVCTSNVESIDLVNGIIETYTGSIYVLQGKGTEDSIEFKDFELLRNGFNPEQIEQLNLSPHNCFQ